MSSLGSWFLTIGASILVFSGVIFDYLVANAIIKFGATLDTIGAMSAITQGWTIFRDISNIVIIGMFTFIAINIILGNKTYGEKKLIARVLIVAVLINFSLLFAKIIIDAGNFTAYQIYSATLAQGASNSQSNDIASAFLKPMGITSTWDTSGVANQFGQSTNSGVQAFFFGVVGGLLLFAVAIMLFYASFLIASRVILLIVVMLTASLAFASHLIPSFSESEYGWSGWWRSLINGAMFAPLLMLFLAITKIILNGAQGITQNLAQGQTTMGAAISGAIQNPAQQVTNNSGWQVIFLYILGIGLLYASLRLSSAFASALGGFNLSSAILASPLTQGSRFAAPLLRNTVGLYRYRQQGQYKKEAGQATADAGLARLRSTSAALAKNPEEAERQAKIAAQKQHEATHKAEASVKAGKKAEGTYNLMDTKAAKKVIQGGLGLTGFASGQSAKGTEGIDKRIKRQAEHAAKVAEITRPSKEATNDTKVRAKEEAQEALARDKVPLEAERDAKEQIAKELRAAADIQAKPIEKLLESAKETEKNTKAQAERKISGDEEKELRAIKEQLKSSSDEYAKAVNTRDNDANERSAINAKYSEDAIRQQIQQATAGLNPDQRATVEQDIRRNSEEQRASELRHQGDRIEQARILAQGIENQNEDIKAARAKFAQIRGSIDSDQMVKDAHANVQELQKQIDTIEKPAVEAEQAFAVAQKNLSDRIKKTDEEISVLGKLGAEINTGVAENAEEIARSEAGWFDRTTGVSDSIASAARGKVKENGDNAAWKKIAKAMKEEKPAESPKEEEH